MKAEDETDDMDDDEDEMATNTMETATTTSMVLKSMRTPTNMDMAKNLISRTPTTREERGGEEGGEEEEQVEGGEEKDKHLETTVTV